MTSEPGPAIHPAAGLSAGPAMVWRAVEHAADRGISLLRTMVLAWLLVPEDFGILAVATVSLDLLLAITNIRTENALIQLEDPDPDDYHRAWTVRFVRLAGVSTVALLAAPLLAAMFDAPAAANILRLLALRPVLTAATSIGVVETRRRLNYRPLVGLALVRAVTDTTIAIALAPSLGVWAIVWGQIIGALARVVASYIAFPHRPRLRWPDRRHDIAQFARWLFIAALVGTAGDALLQAIVSNELGTEDLGRYFFALRVAMFVAVAAVGIVGDVGVGLLAAQQRDDPATRRSLRSMALVMMTLVAPVGLTTAVLAEPATQSLLSADWTGTGGVLAIVGLASIPAAFADVVYPLLYGRGRPAKVTLILITRTAVLLPVAFVFTRAWALEGTAWALLIAELLVLVLGFVLAEREVRGATRAMAAPALAVLAAAAFGAGVGNAIAVLADGAIGVASGAMGSVAAMFLSIIAIDRLTSIDIRRSVELLFPSLAGR